MTATNAATRTTWTLDASHSTVEFVAKHMMITTVKGRFADVTGTIVADEANFTDSSVEVTMQAESLDTRTGERDAHLRSPDFLDVDRYPTITFKSTSIRGTKEKFQVTGDLTIRDVTREVTLQVESVTPEIKDPDGQLRLGATASTRIARKDFGLTWNAVLESGGFVVGDEVDITIDVELVRKAE